MESNEGKIKNKAVGAHCNVPAVIVTCIMLLIIAMVTTVMLLYSSNLGTTRIGSQQLKADSDELEEEKIYSIYMMINELSMLDNTQLAGNKISITPNSELTISYYNAVNGEQIEKDEQGNIQVPEEGIKLKIDGIKEGESYDIEIENKETTTDYEQTFKKATIGIDATQAGELEAYVKDITKEKEGQEETAQGSEENTAIFAYEEENGRIKIKGNKDVEIYYAIVYNDATGVANAEDITEEQWQKYNPETGVEIEKNGTLYAKSKYKDGKYSEIKSLTINNIDKLEPIVRIAEKTTNRVQDEVTVTIEMQDAEATEIYGKSGIYGYAITDTEEAPEEFTPVSGEEPISVQIPGITQNGTYYAWVQDIAGNISKEAINVNEIQERYAVVIVLDAPEESIIGEEYFTLEELVGVLEEKNITAEDGEIIVQVVADITDESTEIEDKNITIDLNGYTIGSILQKPTVKVTSGQVRVVDNKYDIADYIENTARQEKLKRKYSSKAEGKGSIESQNYVAIQVEEGATVTLGEDEGIEAIPNSESPRIEGKLKGILNNGKLNFYDGQIIGKAPVEGEVTDTPILYESIVRPMEEEIYKDTLEKVREIEAIIGRTKYVKLQDAINEANSEATGEQIEIDIVADIPVTTTLTVDNTKNILLDLNGHTVKITEYEVLLRNSGEIEIIDSSITEEDDSTTIKGKFYSNGEREIIENTSESAKLTITSGAIVHEGSSWVIKSNGRYDRSQWWKLNKKHYNIWRVCGFIWLL